MNPGRILSIVILLLIAGCDWQEEEASTAPRTAKTVKTIDSSDAGDPPGVVAYRTGEAVVWPSIPPPMMEISFDLPEVPQHILGPFSKDILPDKE